MYVDYRYIADDDDVISAEEGHIMSGIFYDPSARCLRAVETAPPHDWTLVTHNLDASINLCRRILREWLTPEEISRVDWSTLDRGAA